MSEQHEEQLFRELIDSSQRKRLLTLRKLKNRQKLLSYLPHSIRFDQRYTLAIPANQQSSKQILSLLLKQGSPQKVYVLSEDPKIDSQTLDIQDVMAHIVGSGFASIVSCIPGQLAYYEGEEANNRIILKKPHSSSSNG